MPIDKEKIDVRSGGGSTPPAILGTVPVIESFSEAVLLLPNSVSEFSITVRKTSQPGSIKVLPKIVDSDGIGVSIGNSPVIDKLSNNRERWTYTISSATGTGKFQIQASAAVDGVDNIPLKSELVFSSGIVKTETSVRPNPVVDPVSLQSVVNVPNVEFKLPYEGSISTGPIIDVSVDGEALPGFEITNISLVIQDPRANTRLGVDNRFSAIRRGNTFGFNISSTDFSELGETPTGTLTVSGKTNTVETQTFTENITFFPEREISNYVEKLTASVDVENGERKTIQLFKINSADVIVDRSTISIIPPDGNSRVTFSDPVLNGDIVQVDVYKESGTDAVRFNASVYAKLSNDDVPAHIKNAGAVITKIINSSADGWPDRIDEYVTFNNTEVLIDESQGETSKKKKISTTRPSVSTTIDRIVSRPTAIPSGMNVIITNEENGIQGVWIDVSVSNFSVARGEHIITISNDVYLKQKNSNNTATRTSTVSVPIRVLKRNAHTVYPTQYALKFKITPDSIASMNNVAVVDQYDSTGTVIETYEIGSGLERSWPNGTNLKVRAKQSDTVNGVQYNLSKIQKFKPRGPVAGTFVDYSGTTADITVGADIDNNIITVEYLVEDDVPTLNASFNPTDVNIRNLQTPAAVPIFSATYSRTTKLQLTGPLFNDGNVLEFSVPYSIEPRIFEKYISWDMFGNADGRRYIKVIASNENGRAEEVDISVEFKKVSEPPAPVVDEPGYDSHIFIRDIRIDSPAIERNHTLTVEYDIRNVGRLIIEDGNDDRLADVEIGVETSEGRVIILNANVPTLKRRRIGIDLPHGSYNLFAQIEGQTFPTRANDTSGAPSNTRVYCNTILTVVPAATPPAPLKLTAQDVINALIPAINDQISLEESFLDLINDKKILRNLLVSEDSKREFLITNYIKDVDDSVILKLYDPLGELESVRDKYYIAYELVDPFITTVELTQDRTSTELVLRGPNFNIDDQTDLGLPLHNVNLVDSSKHGSTELLRYDELLNYKKNSELLSISDLDLDGTGYIVSGSITTDILNDVIGGRLITDDDLGINYTNYENFVFYSSAKERLTNFKYKLGLIESHEIDRNLINSGSTSASIEVRNEINYYNTEINDIIATFDGYEKFLYYITGSASWPKINGKAEPSTGSLSANYYTSQSAVAELYDDYNLYSLHKDLPEHIRRDANNDDFLLFVSMLGHHFDLIKVHIDAISRMFVRSHDSNVGTPTKLVKKLLESFGWQIRTQGAQTDLVNYLLGKKQDGTLYSTTSAKQREEELHRRFLNNLPYILKTKGTRASIRALFNMYGIPLSIIRIQEFGGPKLTSDVKRYYTFDDPTQLLNMSGSNQIELDIIDTNLGRKPDAFEITFRTETRPAGFGLNTSGSYQLLTGKDSSNSYVTLNVDSVPGSDFNGKIRLVVSGSTGNLAVTSSKLPIFDNDLYTVGLIRTRSGTSDSIDVYVKKAIYELFTHEVSASLTVPDSMWESSSLMQIGNDFYGSVSEFRAWKYPISEDVFDRHVLYNESISGDNYTSSLSDMVIRIPFERPQNLNTNTSLTNFAWTGSNGYNVSAATASNFSSITSDPYHFEYIEMDSAVEVPSIGFRPDTDKIRFESQSLLDTAELSTTTRITKKQFDQSPIDTNKLGIFISPTDEVNRDIIRSFGGLDFMNEIGNPADYYSSSYSSLDAINEHYWSRHSSGMNIYDYITLVRQFDNTVFDYIDDVKPARAKVVKGLLIEPHMLERNKVQHKKPSKENLFWDGKIDAASTGSFTNEYPTYESNNVDLNDNFIVSGSYPTYEDTIELTDEISVTGESLYWTGSIPAPIADNDVSGSYPTYEATVRANVTASISVDYEETSKMTVVGFEEDFKIPRSLSPVFPGGGYGEPQSAFGIYAKNGYANIIFTKEGKSKQKRFKVELIDIAVSSSISQLLAGQTQGQAGEYGTVVVDDTHKVLNVLNISASFTVGSDRLDGYLPFHRIFTTDLTRGLNNSYYDGSKTTGNSFVDNAKPVETFISKPGVLKVNKKGNSETEPILEIE